MRDINEYTFKYITEEPFEEEIVKIRKKNIVEQCNKYKHDCILEIGCGMSPFFMNYDDCQNIIICEPSKIFIENAQELAKDQKKHIRIIEGFFEDTYCQIDTLEEKIDFIILSSVLHELEHPYKMLECIKKVCTDETILYINVPNAKSLHRVLALEAGLIDNIYTPSAQMIKMQRKSVYDIEMLKNEVKYAGFTIVDEGAYFIKPFTHAQMQKCLDFKIIDNKILEGLERLLKYFPDYGAGIFVCARIKSVL